MLAYALVDYDNVKPIEKERSSFDVEYNVERIATRCAEIVRGSFAECREVTLRFYGGWTDKANSRTAAGVWIYGALAQARGRKLGVRVSPEVAINNIFSEMPPLVGLYREGGQKMVDTLLVADMVWIASKYDGPILVMSDDEDMLPGVVATRLMKRRVAVSRKRALGESMNDFVYKSLNIGVEGCLA